MPGEDPLDRLAATVIKPGVLFVELGDVAIKARQKIGRQSDCHKGIRCHAMGLAQAARAVAG
jgi:hypothetical protein